MRDISQRVQVLMKELEPRFIEDLHWFHENPEMSFQERDTTAYIRRELETLGVEILDTGLETGLVGLLEGGSKGPSIALRADIDALPVTEESTCTYPSKRPGMMHACGHDTHAASLLSAARILSRMREEIHGSVRLFFQPAEEVNLGAKKMVELGCLEGVDAIFGMHNSPEIPLGTVAVKHGALMAAVDRIEITVKGKGGHGGIPQRNVDPVVCAAAIIQSAQTIVSRNVSPIDSCVLSICNVRAGEGANNVTPDKVTMLGTVRTYSKEVEACVVQRLKAIVESTAAAYGCEGSLNYIYELPPTINNESLYQAAYEAVTSIGAEPVDPIPSTGGEDFSVFMEEKPGFFYWLGTRNEENDCVYSWHSPHFKADERC
ncbi:MAG: M20 metallopeptidase family protein [Blautia sp.]